MKLKHVLPKTTPVLYLNKINIFHILVYRLKYFFKFKYNNPGDSYMTVNGRNIVNYDGKRRAWASGIYDHCVR